MFGWLFVYRLSNFNMVKFEMCLVILYGRSKATVNNTTVEIVQPWNGIEWTIGIKNPSFEYCQFQHTLYHIALEYHFVSIINVYSKFSLYFLKLNFQQQHITYTIWKDLFMFKLLVRLDRYVKGGVVGFKELKRFATTYLFCTQMSGNAMEHKAMS